MVETLYLASAPLEPLKRLVDTQQSYFSEQLDLDNLLDEFAELGMNAEKFNFLVQCSISDRLQSIGLKGWREEIVNMTESIPFNAKRAHLMIIRSKLATYECGYRRLKEATTMLELALWKAKMNGSKSNNTRGRRKKMKIDEQGLRNQCRISCGSDIVIQHVLPYLLPAN
jgi:hypothetical protein